MQRHTLFRVNKKRKASDIEDAKAEQAQFTKKLLAALNAKPAPRLKVLKELLGNIDTYETPVSPALPRELDGVTPIFVAVQRACVPAVKQLLRKSIDLGAKPFSENADERTTPLFEAVKGGFGEIVSMLVNYVKKHELDKSLLNWGNDNDVTPLFIAVDRSQASEGNYAAIMELLLKAGADPNLAPNGGIRPLARAIQLYTGNITVIGLLCKYRADMSLGNENFSLPRLLSYANPAYRNQLAGYLTALKAVQELNEYLTEMHDLKRVGIIVNLADYLDCLDSWHRQRCEQLLNQFKHPEYQAMVTDLTNANEIDRLIKDFILDDLRYHPLELRERMYPLYKRSYPTIFNDQFLVENLMKKFTEIFSKVSPLHSYSVLVNYCASPIRMRVLYVFCYNLLKRYTNTDTQCFTLPRFMVEHLQSLFVALQNDGYANTDNHGLKLIQLLAGACLPKPISLSLPEDPESPPPVALPPRLG